MYSFDEVMRRLRSYSEGVHPDTGDKIEPYKTHKNNNLANSETENNKNHKTYNDYQGLYLLIHSDKDFLLAQEWGMKPGLLYNLCKKYGTRWVKSCIQTVNAIGPRYFKEGEALEPQRG